jgi:hypothetical protein
MFHDQIVYRVCKECYIQLINTLANYKYNIFPDTDSMKELQLLNCNNLMNRTKAERKFEVEIGIHNSPSQLSHYRWPEQVIVAVTL